jgi:hypothetical protein
MEVNDEVAIRECTDCTMEVNDEVAIREVLRNTPWKLIYCPSCTPLVLPSCSCIESHTCYSWAKLLRCSSCGTKWTVCTECDQCRIHLTTNRQVKDHHRFYHDQTGSSQARRKKYRTASNEDEAVGGDINDFVGNDEQCDDNNRDVSHFETGYMAHEVDEKYNKLLSIALLGDPTFDNYLPFTSKRYFEMEQCNGIGAKSLVALASFHDVSAATLIKDEEASLHLNITRLLCSLTRCQMEDLGSIFGQLVPLMNAQLNMVDGHSLWRTKIPTSPQEMRSLYTRGKYAIISNLPRPSVQSLSSHAYVSLKECVADLLGHGFDVDTIDNCTYNCTVNVISESQRAKDIYGRGSSDGNNKMFLYVNEWSDAFEPSRSSKSNRGSCWIKTITIAPRTNGSNAKRISYTYPIALGLEGTSHEEVEARFAAELKEFKSSDGVTFYHGGIKRNITVYLELFASLQDQPERRKANCIMLGGSKYTARWGYSVDMYQVRQYIPPCTDCEVALRNSSQLDHHISGCSRCVCWDVTKDSTLLHFEPPPNYPIEVALPSGKLSPKKLCYATLKSAVTASHENYVKGSWSKANVESYLKVTGLNSSAINSVMQCANNCKDLVAVLSLDPTTASVEDIQRAQQTLQHKDQNPSAYEMWRMPAIWNRGVDLHQHIDVVMHLLFLGVVRTTTEMVQEWSKRRGKNAAFVRYLEGTLESLQLLGLDWCRCVPYKSGKFGGWVSENYVAVSRLLTWLFRGIDSIAPDTPTDDPEIPQRRWNKRQNCHWLSIRGLSVTGSALEVSARVREYQTQPNGAPPVLPPPGGTVQVLTSTLMNLKAMTARIMASSVTEASIKDVDLHIKRFLTTFHKFDLGMRGGNDKPTWLTSYNFICLTNLPKILQEFGPVRNVWEGGEQGEKVIGILKPLWHGFKNNWHVNLLTKALNIMAIERLSSTQILNNNKKLASKKMFHKYKSVHDIVNNYIARKPMSVVQLVDGRFGCITRRTKTFVQLNPMDETKLFLGGSWYCNWSSSMQDVQLHDIDISNIIHYCLLLPQLTATGMPMPLEDDIKYTLITSEWMERNDTGTFTLPTSAVT